MIDARTAPYGALLLRVVLGAQFIAHGLLKVLVLTIPGTVRFFVAIGYPEFVAYLVIVAELGGGLALVLGVFARWIALALAAEMIGAVVYHWPKGWLFTAPGGGWEYPALWTAALVALFLVGDGPFALRSARPKPQERG
jgi:putative oxidoreductase